MFPDFLAVKGWGRSKLELRNACSRSVQRQARTDHAVSRRRLTMSSAYVGWILLLADEL